MKKLILTLLTAALAFTGIAGAGEYPDISVADLKKAIAEKKVVIIDVNGTNGWQRGHVPTAIDYAAARENLAEVLPKDKATLVVAYCGGPSCNAYTAAASAAKNLGYTNVKHLSAGISGWTAAGEKTEKGKAKKEEAPKKGASTDAAPHTYVATFTGVTCAGCKADVSEAIAKLPGGANVKFEAGKKEGTQKVTFTASCDQVCKDKLVTALGDDAKTYVVQELAIAKQ